jgi:hypothetical protein
VSFEGSLRETPLRLVLDAIGSERQTGILTVQDAQEIVAVTFLRGEIVGADTLSGGDEILGQALAEAHVVRPDEFAAVVALHRTGGGRVSDLLLERGLLDRPTLLRALRTQSLILLKTVMHWTDGTYKFYTGEDLSFEEGFDPIDVDELLLQGGSFGASALTAQDDRGTGAHELFATPPPETLPPVRPELTSAAGLRSPVPSAPQSPAPPSAAIPPAVVEAAARPQPPARPGLQPAPPAPPAPAGAEHRPEHQAPVRGKAPEAPLAWEGPLTPAVPVPSLRVDKAKALRPQAASENARWQPAFWLAAGLVLPIVLVGLFPSLLMPPLPWASGVYRELRDTRREGAFRRIDAASRTYCLVEGQYPQALETLAEEGLLTAADLWTSTGEPILFSGSSDSYALRTTQGALLSGDASVESTAGNIFLDVAFSENAGTDSKPLILLD